MKITKIYSRYYDSSARRYIVIVQVRRGTRYEYRPLTFGTRQEMEKVQVGDFVNNENGKV